LLRSRGARAGAGIRRSSVQHYGAHHRRTWQHAEISTRKWTHAAHLTFRCKPIRPRCRRRSRRVRRQRPRMQHHSRSARGRWNRAAASSSSQSPRSPGGKQARCRCRATPRCRRIALPHAQLHDSCHPLVEQLLAPPCLQQLCDALAGRPQQLALRPQQRRSARRRQPQPTCGPRPAGGGWWRIRSPSRGS
jgi:hypothetical protein